MARRPKKSGYDLTDVTRAARGQWLDALERLGGLDRSILDGSHHPCPKCGGNDRFRMIDEDAGAVLCNQCFRERNGDGVAALQWLRGWSFLEAIEQLGEFFGAAKTENGRPGRAKSKRDADPASDLDFTHWNEQTVATWCWRRKPGVTAESVRAIGGQLARYRNTFSVLAIPGYGTQGREAPPASWTLYNLAGKTLPKKVGDKISQVKVKLTYGSRSSLIGDWSGSIVWKVEGPTDLVALISLGLPEGVTACTNANGAGEHPGWMAEQFAGKTVFIVHDADQPGQDGAARWSAAIAEHAAETRLVRLPYDVAPDHGRDLRDWINEGHLYQDLVDLAAAAEIVAPPAGDAEPIYTPIEADDDPFRLARINLERFAALSGGQATLRFWRSEWYKWQGVCYEPIPESELRARIGSTCKIEFDRINIDKQKSGEIENELTPHARKVSSALITSVLQATASLTALSGSVEWNTWIDSHERERRSLVAFRNGLLDIDAVLAGKEDAECLLPHSPNWWSRIELPYAFDAAATCPKWESILNENLEGDAERIALLQEWAGYLLLPDTGQQKMMMLEGQGANGKSVFLAGIRAMLGEDNCASVPLENFSDRFSRYQTIGRLVNISADAGEVDKAAEGLLKSFVSGDTIFFDRKGLPGIEAVPTARLMIAVNNRPRFSDHSDGIWRRMLLVPWRLKIAEDRKIRNMDKVDWWQRSGELPGMFNWALLGLDRLRAQRRFTEPAISSASLVDYRAECNPAAAFLEEFLEASQASNVRTQSVYAAYKFWCHENGYRALSDRTLGKEITRMFPSVERCRGGSRSTRYWYYAGLNFSQQQILDREISQFHSF